MMIILEIYQPDDLKGRPIVSGPESPNQRLSWIVKMLLKPVVPHLVTCIKDDWELIKFLPMSLTFYSDIIPVI